MHVARLLQSLLLALIVLAAGAGAAAAQTSPFGRGSPNTPGTSAPDERGAADKSSAAPEKPSFLGRAYNTYRRWQAALNRWQGEARGWLPAGKGGPQKGEKGAP